MLFGLSVDLHPRSVRRHFAPSALGLPKQSTWGWSQLSQRLDNWLITGVKAFCKLASYFHMGHPCGMAANSTLDQERFAQEEGSVSCWEMPLCLSAGGSRGGFPLALTGGRNAAPTPNLAQAWGKLRVRKTLPWLGCDSAKHLRLLLEQNKAEECL